MSFSFDGTIPTANQAISQTQSPIQQNFSSISTLIDVDHVTFNDSQGGQHTQVTFSENTAPGSLPNSSVGIAYVKAGVANSSKSDSFLYNGTLSFPMNCIRAAGLFSTSSSTSSFTGSQQINCASISTVSGGGSYTYTITLTTGSTTTDNVMIFVDSRLDIAIGKSFASNVLTLTSPSGTNGVLVSFFIIQV